MNETGRWSVRVAAVLLAGVCVAAPSLGEVVWGGVLKDIAGPFAEETAQQFSALGAPDLVLGGGFDTFGRYHSLAVSGTTLFSARRHNVHCWDAIGGAEIGPLDLDSPLPDHLEDYVHGIGATTTGDLLFSPYGFSTQQRTVARYSPGGTWIADYSAPELQHVQGSPAGNEHGVFVASRHDDGTGWTEDLLMFASDGTFLGSFGSELGGDAADVAVMGDCLYTMNYTDGIYVYDLAGTMLPTFSHLIPFPAGVEPSATATDTLTAGGGYLYVGDSPAWGVPGDPGWWHKVDLAGELLGSYEAQIEKDPLYGNALGPLAVVPEPATMLMLSLAAGLAACRRR